MRCLFLSTSCSVRKLISLNNIYPFYLWFLCLVQPYPQTWNWTHCHSIVFSKLFKYVTEDDRRIFIFKQIIIEYSWILTEAVFSCEINSFISLSRMKLLTFWCTYRALSFTLGFSLFSLCFICIARKKVFVATQFL